MNFVIQASLLFGAAVIAIPIAKRIGLGAVLGYLFAGIVVGPWGFRFISNVDDIFHFAELGVVFLLFLVGIELNPKRLWVMRRTVLGLGVAQVVITAIPIAIIAYVFLREFTPALIIGVTLALSSTAFALQTLSEKQQLNTRHGRAAFSILLLQDIAVVPLLAIIPLLGTGAETKVFSWWALIKTIGIVALVILVGRYIVHYFFKIVAETGVREVFIAFALLIVLGTALLLEETGLSMALGAFLAGVLLSESEYRHELQADIDPFKGLLLGLFFMAVGMTVNFGLLNSHLLEVVLIAIGLMAVKFIVLLFLGRAFGLSWTSATSLAAFLPQGGEFAFIILNVAVASFVLSSDISQLLILAVTLSMIATPLLVSGVETIQKKWKSSAPSYDHMPESENQVVIAGFGRVGQIVARILRAKRIGFTALDNSSGQVDFVKRYGNKVYYGDASRLDLLRSAGAEKANLFILTIGDPEISLRTAEMVTRNFPNLKIIARARNRKHVYQLMDLGITQIWRDTFYSSLKMAEATLESLGLPRQESSNVVETFRQHDEQRLHDDHELHNDEQRMIYLAKKSAKELEEQFEQDEKEAS
ncbi:MAG: monovalent cation:proton antiporter-2 (CPA2) family protein [Arenicellales bacterium]|nr:monovalent cation:proton antiporter-2 (CPA2) family protein [Arenicellales bacterium]